VIQWTSLWQKHQFLNRLFILGLSFENWHNDVKSPRDMVVEPSWNVIAHGDAREKKWRGNWRMEWVASTLHTTSGHGVSSITTADAHTSTASSRLNWSTHPPTPRRFYWTRLFRLKTKSGFCVCAITFQTSACVFWRWRHCEGADSLCTNYLQVSFNPILSTLENEWSTLLPIFGKHKFNVIVPPPPQFLNPQFRNSVSGAILLTSSVLCIVNNVFSY